MGTEEQARREETQTDLTGNRHPRHTNVASGLVPEVTEGEDPEEIFPNFLA
jgi:hypothetical protein